jgi:hypothetical protein
MDLMSFESWNSCGNYQIKVEKSRKMVEIAEEVQKSPMLYSDDINDEMSTRIGKA